MTFLRRMLDRALGRHHAAPVPVVPANRDHARTLERADAMLADPKIKRILSVRDAEMKDSFARARRRLGA